MNWEQRCEPIRLILSDVDGVMTDGGLTFDNQGVETKTFHVRDGAGIKLWQRSGGRFGIVTGRTSRIVQIRASELAVEIVRQGVADKWTAVKQILAQLELEPRQVCYLGDDLPDLTVMRQVGLPISVADGVAEVRAAAAYVTTALGGRGAVREAVEWILKQQHRWDDIVQHYTGS